MAKYVITIETEPCELPGVTFVSEGPYPNGYCAQSAPGGGERDALAGLFQVLEMVMMHASPEQVEGALRRWQVPERQWDQQEIRSKSGEVVATIEVLKED